MTSPVDFTDGREDVPLLSSANPVTINAPRILRAGRQPISLSAWRQPCSLTAVQNDSFQADIETAAGSCGGTVLLLTMPIFACAAIPVNRLGGILERCMRTTSASPAPGATPRRAKRRFSTIPALWTVRPTNSWPPRHARCRESAPCANPCSAGRLNGGDAGGHLRAVANREPNPGQPAVELDESRAEQVSSRSSRGMARSASLLARVVEVEVWVERAWWSVSPSVAYSPKRLMRSLMYGERGPQLLE